MIENDIVQELLWVLLDEFPFVGTRDKMVVSGELATWVDAKRSQYAGTLNWDHIRESVIAAETRPDGYEALVEKAVRILSERSGSVAIDIPHQGGDPNHPLFAGVHERVRQRIEDGWRQAHLYTEWFNLAIEPHPPTQAMEFTVSREQVLRLIASGAVWICEPQHRFS